MLKKFIIHHSLFIIPYTYICPNQNVILKNKISKKWWVLTYSTL